MADAQQGVQEQERLLKRFCSDLRVELRLSENTVETYGREIRFFLDFVRRRTVGARPASPETSPQPGNFPQSGCLNPDASPASAASPDRADLPAQASPAQADSQETSPQPGNFPQAACLNPAASPASAAFPASAAAPAQADLPAQASPAQADSPETSPQPGNFPQAGCLNPAASPAQAASPARADLPAQAAPSGAFIPALCALQTPDLEEYLLEREGAGAGSRTLAKSVSCLRVFFRFLEAERLIERNPALLLQSPSMPKNLPAVLSLEEVEALLGVIDTSDGYGVRDRALFELIYSCGLRISEACALNVGDLYPEEGLILVHGKGDKMRYVPLGAEALFYLNRYLREVRPTLLKKGEKALFIGRLGERMSRKGMWKRFNEWARLAGVTAKVHTLRHSFATHLLAGGAGLRAVQMMLGHADISTTQIYTHVDTGLLQKTHQQYHPRG